MKNFLALAMMFVSVQAIAAGAIPANKKVCTLLIQGSNSMVAAYSCDGEAPVQLENVNRGESFAEISGQILKFINAGYQLVNCQYVVGAGMSPQYVCNFIHQ